MLKENGILSLKKGKQLYFFMFSGQLIVFLSAILVNYLSNEINIFKNTVGLTIFGILYFFIYHGFKWSKWILIILMSIVEIVAIYKIITISPLEFYPRRLAIILMAYIYFINIGIMLLSKNFNYFLSRKM